MKEKNEEKQNLHLVSFTEQTAYSIIEKRLNYFSVKANDLASVKLFFFHLINSPTKCQRRERKKNS